MIIHLKIIGSLLITLSLVHGVFPSYFGWKDGLASLSLINRQMMQVHTFFIAFFIFLIGVLCIISAEEIVDTTIGKQIALGLAIFWFVRLIFQLFVYSPKLWKGNSFRTIVHVLFTSFWIYMTTVFYLIYLSI